MLIKKFEAVDLKDAISRVKAEMGANAVILNHRKIKKGDAAFGIFGRTVIEVTAALDDSVADESENESPKSKKQKKNRTAPQSAVELSAMIDPLRDEIREIKELIGSSISSSALGRTELKKAAEISDELLEIKSLAAYLLERTDFVKGKNLAPNYLVCYRRMVERGLDPEFALRLLEETREGVPGKRELDVQHIVNEIAQRLEEAMIIGEPIAPSERGTRVVSLVGTTGVGKTTTIAKIAAEQALKGNRVALITIDTYRIAAVEQLKSYADILGIPIRVVFTPEELLAAVEKFSQKDIVLIDTAGRSQRDAQKLDELASFLGGEELVENYLVLSAAAEPKVTDESVKNFSRIPLAGLIFTKLDESLKPGVAITQNLKTGLPLAYCTTGQKVPEDIENASAKKLVMRMFKKEV